MDRAVFRTYFFIGPNYQPASHLKFMAPNFFVEKTRESSTVPLLNSMAQLRCKVCRSGPGAAEISPRLACCENPIFVRVSPSSNASKLYSRHETRDTRHRIPRRQRGWMT